MNKPDVVFKVSVHEVLTLRPCAERVRRESEGYFGFHDSRQCTECQLTPRGYEMWGENGHCQGRAVDREHLAYWLKLKARTQWRTHVTNRLMGYGTVTLEGPHYPQPHRWYATAKLENSVIVSVK